MKCVSRNSGGINLGSKNGFDSWSSKCVPFGCSLSGGWKCGIGCLKCGSGGSKCGSSICVSAPEKACCRSGLNCGINRGIFLGGKSGIFCVSLLIGSFRGMVGW